MSQDAEKLIADAVQKALNGDMDAINNIEDRVTRSKAKSALVKAKRRAKVAANESASEVENDKPPEKTSQQKSFSETLADRINKKFSDTIDEEEVSGHIQIKGDKWKEIALYLRDDPDYLFDSLQCITGYDFGEG